MTDQLLSERLQAAAPGPGRDPDIRTLWQRGRRRRRRRQVLAALVVAPVALVAVLGVAGVVRTTTDPVEVVLGEPGDQGLDLAVMRRPAPTSGPRAPLHLVEQYERMGLVDARVLLEREDVRYWVAVGASGEVCAFKHPINVVRSRGGVCHPRATFEADGYLAMASSDGDVAPPEIVVVVPDGWSEVRYAGRRIPVLNNAFLIDEPPYLGTAVLIGPDGERTIELPPIPDGGVSSG